GLGHPLEAHRVALGHVRTLDDDAVGVRQVLQEVGRATTAERGTQTGHRGGVLYAGLVLDLDRAHGRVELLHEVVLLVVEGRPSEARYPHGAVDALAVDLVLPALAAGVEHAVGDHVHRRVEVEVLPLRPVRTAVADLRLPGRAGDQLLARAALRAQPAAADRQVRVALDLDDLLVLDEDPLPAADGAVGAHALHHAVGGGGAGDDMLGRLAAPPCRGRADRSRSAAGTPATRRARSSR